MKPDNHAVVRERIRYSQESAPDPVSLEVLVRGQGPLVVLIASLGRGAEDFDDLAARLATNGYRTAAINPRGIGDSTGPAARTLQDYAADAAHVVRSLSPEAPAILVGHAFGNRVARATAAFAPGQVSGLVLLACGGQAPIPPAAATALRDVFDESLSAEAHMAAVQTAFFAPGNDPAVWSDGWYPAVALAQQTALHATPLQSWSGGGTVDIYIVQAEADVIAPPANAEALRAAYPDRVTVATLPNAGHAILPEQPERLAELVLTGLSLFTRAEI